MKGIEKDLRDMAIDALTKAYHEIGSLRCDFAVEPVGSGKADTYGLDAIPEEVIRREVDDYDGDIVLITEETGKIYSGEEGLEPTQTVLICDPTDRSIKMREFLQQLISENPGVRTKTVKEVFSEHRDKWESEFGNPTISGASGSVTAIRDRYILFNVMVNYVTGELFIADSVGTRKGRLNDQATHEVRFPSGAKGSRRFATFLGKAGYPDNLDKCNLGLRQEDCTDPWTCGPLRILDLSELSGGEVSFILSNGEKVCEWIGWLAWVKYAVDPIQPDERALEAFRLFFECPRTQELVLVAPAPHYSIFVQEDDETRVNLQRMFQLPDPSHYRETILITPKRNMGAISRVRSLGSYQEQLRP